MKWWAVAGICLTMLTAWARYCAPLLTGREPYGPKYEHASVFLIFLLVLVIMTARRILGSGDDER